MQSTWKEIRTQNVLEHAFGDCVPASNTVRLEQALAKANVPHQCQIFPTGGHGIGLGYQTFAKTWSEEMLRFFENTFHRQ